VFALILDSLGGTELLFILVVALIFFGPRKLPELARTMGKGLAEFRKASDDFKRTWEREVEIEASRVTDTSFLNEDSSTQSIGPAEVNSSSENEATLYKPVDEELVVARGSSQTPPSSEPEPAESPALIEPTRKQDWL
jgi:TatA/E family protein of Tat protein translocase